MLNFLTQENIHVQYFISITALTLTNKKTLISRNFIKKYYENNVESKIEILKSFAEYVNNSDVPFLKDIEFSDELDLTYQVEIKINSQDAQNFTYNPDEIKKFPIPSTITA